MGPGEPAPCMSREQFLRLLDAAEYLAAHIHEAPVWIVPCLEGATPTRASGWSILSSGAVHATGGAEGGSGLAMEIGRVRAECAPTAPAEPLRTVGVGSV
jgi:hypothetical protein